MRAARHEYHKIQKRTPRRKAYLKSSYFKKDKVFINQFWVHLEQKRSGDQVRRARLFLCAIDLIRKTTEAPSTITSLKTKNSELHRFYGKTKEGTSFCVQIRENKRTGRKDFMSVFPLPK